MRACGAACASRIADPEAHFPYAARRAPRGIPPSLDRFRRLTIELAAAPPRASYRNGCTFRPAVRSESEARRRVPLLLCYGGTEIVDKKDVAQHFKPLEGQSWNPPSLRARLERSWPARRPQTRAEVQPQIPPDHAAERRTANSPSSRQWMRKGLRRR